MPIEPRKKLPMRDPEAPEEPSEASHPIKFQPLVPASMEVGSIWICSADEQGSERAIGRYVRTRYYYKGQWHPAGKFVDPLTNALLPFIVQFIAEVPKDA